MISINFVKMGRYLIKLGGRMPLIFSMNYSTYFDFDILLLVFTLLPLFTLLFKSFNLVLLEKKDIEIAVNVCFTCQDRRSGS